MELSPEVLAALQSKASQGGTVSPVATPTSSISSDVLEALKAKASSALSPQITPNEMSAGRFASAVQGASGGFLDELSAGVTSLPGYLGALTGGNSENLSLSDVYQEQLNKNRAGLERYKEADPTASTAMEVAGSVVSPINKILGGGRLGKQILSAGVQGGIFGAGQAEGNENILTDTLQGVGLGAGTTGAIGGIGKGIGAIASKADDVGQATKNKLFGVQYSDIKKSLDKDVRALGDTEAPIQKALNKLAKEGAVKPGEAIDNLANIENQIGDLGKQVKSVLNKADAVQPNPLVPKYNFTEDFIDKLDSDAKVKAQEVYKRLKKSQQNNILLSDWELEKSALSKAGATSYGMQGSDALEANLKKYMARDIKDAVDSELANPLYQKALGKDFQNIKDLRTAMADRFKVQGALTKAAAREGSSDLVQKLKGIIKTTGGYGVPMILGGGMAGPAGVLLGAGAGAVLESTAGQKALIKALEATAKGGKVGDLVGKLAPVAGQIARTANSPEEQIEQPSEKAPLEILKQEIGKSKMGAEENKNILLNKISQSGITDPDEIAQFMAQMEHESAGFKKLKEMASGKDYEGKANLGNTQKGDGEKFKGRGFVQLTGRYNYKKYGDMIGVDLVNNPELAENPEIAAELAVAYWNDRVKPKVSDFKDVKAVTKLINGGLNGLEDRQKKFSKYNSGNKDILASLTQIATGEA